LERDVKILVQIRIMMWKYCLMSVHHEPEKNYATFIFAISSWFRLTDPNDFSRLQSEMINTHISVTSP